LNSPITDFPDFSLMYGAASVDELILFKIDATS
jgi:hypothetical protein